MTGELCEAGIVTMRPGFVPEVTVCNEPATGFFTYACVHEHVVSKWTCDAHHPRPGFVGCVQCLAAGHECEMAFREASPERAR